MNITLDTLRKEEEVALRLRSLYESFGYKKYKMAKFEEYGFYIENKNFLQSNQIIAFNDADGRLMALKPDVTLSIVKNTNATENACEKLYYSENVYRMNMQGREYKEISQTGLEFIGNVTALTTLEIVMLATRSLKIIHDRYILDISHMGYITGMLDALIGEAILKENVIDCIRKKNVHELEKLCLAANIPESDTEKLKALITLSGPFSETLKDARKYVLNDEMKNALDELEKISCADDGSFRLDFSIINDLSYYNGIIFRGYVEPLPKAVLSGGRYDNLLEKMGRKNLNALGFAVYFDEFDRYFKSSAASKTDIVILYNENTDPALLWTKVDEYSQKGSILVCESLPEGVIYSSTEDLRK